MNANARIGLAAFGFVALMIGVAYASVPLYKLFCQVTGFGGTTQVAEASPTENAAGRAIRVEFDANVNRALPWAFKPSQRGLDMQVGEERLAYYEARNLTARTTNGTATFNVTPLKAGKYFNKVACFCFTEQKLEGGESVQMPVNFFIDPAIEQDPNMHDVKTITLSYTFFNADADS